MALRTPCSNMHTQLSHSYMVYRKMHAPVWRSKNRFDPRKSEGGVRQVEVPLPLHRPTSFRSLSAKPNAMSGNHRWSRSSTARVISWPKTRPGPGGSRTEMTDSTHHSSPSATGLSLSSLVRTEMDALVFSSRAVKSTRAPEAELISRHLVGEMLPAKFVSPTLRHRAFSMRTAYDWKAAPMGEMRVSVCMFLHVL